MQRSVRNKGALLALLGLLLLATTAQQVTNPNGSGTTPSSCTVGTGCAVVAGSGSLGFEITVGTTPGTTGTITMPVAAVHGWRITCDDLTTITEYARTTAFTSTTVTTLTFFANGGTATAPTAADTLACNAGPA